MGQEHLARLRRLLRGLALRDVGQSTRSANTINRSDAENLGLQVVSTSVGRSVWSNTESPGWQDPGRGSDLDAGDPVLEDAVLGRQDDPVALAELVQRPERGAVRRSMAGDADPPGVLPGVRRLGVVTRPLLERLGVGPFDHHQVHLDPRDADDRYRVTGDVGDTVGGIGGGEARDAALELRAEVVLGRPGGEPGAPQVPPEVAAQHERRGDEQEPRDPEDPATAAPPPPGRRRCRPGVAVENLRFGHRFKCRSFRPRT